MSQVNLDAAKFCREIDGDLNLTQPNLATVDATALPYLTRVRGNLVVGNGSVAAPSIVSITIANLETVDGEIEVGFLQNMTTLSLPRLTSTDSIITSLAPKLMRISLPQLQSVAGTLTISRLEELAQLDIGKLTYVGGAVTLTSLCKLPWSQVLSISALGTSQAISGIGCCTFSTDSHECGMGCSCSSN